MVATGGGVASGGYDVAVYGDAAAILMRTSLAGTMLLTAACGSGTSTSTTKAESASASASAVPAGPPAGVLAIGHSGLTGESSDPAKVGAPAPENSWATGTSPEVDSVYLRLLAVRPETKDRVANRAVGGAQAFALAGQAAAGLKEVPNPALVIVQTIDNDIRCDGADAANVSTFGSQLTDALSIITAAAPKAKILMVGQIGRPATAVKAIGQLPAEKQKLTGTGPCDLFDPAGNVATAKVAALTKIIEGYEAEQARVCGTLPQCVTDNGALGRFVDRPDYSIAGHLTRPALANVAALIWPTVRKLLL